MSVQDHCDHNQENGDHKDNKENFPGSEVLWINRYKLLFKFL